MKHETKLNDHLIKKFEDFSSTFIRENAEAIPALFQVSLLDEIDIRLEKIPELFLMLVEQITTFDAALIYIWEPADMWFCKGLQGKIPDTLEQGNIFTHFIRKSARPILIKDRAQADLDPNDIPMPFSSMLGLPIYIDTKTIGCVELYRREGPAFSLTDATLIKHLLLYSEKILSQALGRRRVSDKDEVFNLRMDIPQRHVIMDILHQYVEQAHRLSFPLSVALVAIKDLECFEQSLGLYQGAKILRSMAKRIKNGLRCYDCVLRYEETSFFVILPGCSSQEAINALTNATLRLGNTLSDNLIIGVATLPSEASDTKGLINAAHQALSHARKNDLRVATYLQTGAVKPINLSQELTLKRIISTGPSNTAMDSLLEVVRIQCQLNKINISQEPSGCPVTWDGAVIGYLHASGLPDEIRHWILSYLTPAWAAIQQDKADTNDWQASVLSMLSILSDIRAGYPLGYSLRVADQMFTLARIMGKDENEANRWSLSALAANIGYMGIPAYIFTKDEVNPFDKKKIKNHPIISARLLKEAFVLDLDSNILAYHHEQLDGSGYPRGLRGDEIPDGARALRVVDTYNAMITPRLYREQRGIAEARAEMATQAGVTLDAALTEFFLESIK